MRRRRIALFLAVAGLLAGTMPCPKETSAAGGVYEDGYAHMVSGMQRNREFANTVMYYCGPRNQKQVALTFDDGPDMKYTPQVLDILKENHIHATFFLLGLNVEKYPEIAKRIAEEGHSIGNHTYSHSNLVKLSAEQVREQVRHGDETLQRVLGFHTAIFRPPYGNASREVLQQVASMQYKVIDWSVDTRDWASPSPAQILSTVNQQIFPGGIVLQHSANAPLRNSVKALPDIIASLKAQGYTFATIPEMLHIPERME